MNNTSLASCAAAGLLPALALAQPLFSNASADPGIPALGASALTQSGVPAPGGFQWSEAAVGPAGESDATAGFSTHTLGAPGDFRFTDDFTVTSGGGWYLRDVTVYAYQPDYAGGVSPFAALAVRVWNGPPWAVGSAVVCGDAGTNRMTSSVSAGVYRVFNTVVAPLPTAPTTARHVWATTATLGNTYLPPGTYWLDWQYTSINPDAGVFSPPVTVPGARNQPGNARQFRAAVGTLPEGWFEAIDAGKPPAAADLPRDLPFLLAGATINACDPDYNMDGNPDQDDIAALIQDIAAGTTTYPPHDPDFNGDGNVDQDDLAALINVVAGGACP